MNENQKVPPGPGDTPLFEVMLRAVEELLHEQFYRRCTNDEQEAEFHAEVAKVGQFLIDSHTE